MKTSRHVATRPQPKYHEFLKPDMPLYDYFCPTNQRTIEVQHRMHEEIRTWGDLVSAAGIDAGDTPQQSEVRRMITGGSVMTASAGDARPQASCGAHCACHGGDA